jgi:hypothetical protein
MIATRRSRYNPAKLRKINVNSSDVISRWSG